MYKIIALSAIATTTFLAGCASMGHNPKSLDEEMAYRSHQQSEINKELASAANEVTKSLNELMALERGEATSQLKNDGRMDTTVAASHNNFNNTKKDRPRIRTKEHVAKEMKARNPEKVSKETQVANTDYMSDAEYARQNSISSLKTKIKVAWNGPADQFIDVLTNRVDFDFVIMGGQRAPEIIIPEQQTTVVKALRLVADKLEGVADINVSLENRVVALKYKKSSDVIKSGNGISESQATTKRSVMETRPSSN